jgi:hypothetical protein
MMWLSPAVADDSGLEVNALNGAGETLSGHAADLVISPVNQGRCCDGSQCI